jgi:serralysin
MVLSAVLWGGVGPYLDHGQVKAHAVKAEAAGQAKAKDAASNASPASQSASATTQAAQTSQPTPPTQANASGIPVAPFISAPYTCVTNYYISKSGRDSNSGTSVGSAWLTIGHAISVLGGRSSLGGTCVNVGDGTYKEAISATGVKGSSDSPTGYFVVRSQNLHGATVHVPLSQAKGYQASFRFHQSNYIIIDGFNLTGDVVSGSLESGVDLCSRGSPCHHIKILNNVIHDHGGGGISAVHTDYLVVQGNVVYNNASSNPYQTSGISTYQAVASDNNPGFHNIISYNISFNNKEVDIGQPEHSDGNGIIIDDFRNSQSGSTYGVYAPRTLVENNLAYGNGGRGIHVFFTNNVTVRNNTTYGNCQDSVGLQTWRAEMDAVSGGHNNFVNNIAYAVQAPNKWNAPNYAYADNSTDNSNVSNVWKNNIGYAGSPGQYVYMADGSQTAFTAADGNILGSDPMFTYAAGGDFTLRSSSPAIAHGTTAYGVPTTDLRGVARGGTPDMGAYYP